MAGISPSSLQPQPYAGYNPSYAPSGYMPGAPAGFIMNPFVYIPPKVTAPPPAAAPVVEPPVAVSAPSFKEEETPQQQQERAIAEAKQLDYYLPSGELNPDYNGPTYMGGNVDEQGRPIPGYAATMPNIKDIGSVALSLAVGGPLAAAYTAADKLLLGDALPGPWDALKAAGNVIATVGGGLGGLFGLNTPPVTTSSSTNTGISWVPLSPPPISTDDQIPEVGQGIFTEPSPIPIDEVYQQWLADQINAGQVQEVSGPNWWDNPQPETDELTRSPGEDVASWSEDPAQAAETEQWWGV